MRYTREDLKALQAATLDEKIDHSLSMIEIFYLREHGNCYISFSGGKDSTVLKYLIEHEYPARGGRLLQDIPSVFSDTGLEYPEIRKFAMRQKNVISVRLKMNFLEVLRHYGYPLISKAVSDAIVEAKRTPGGSRWKRMHGECRRNDGGRSQFDYSKWLPLMDLPIKISDECCGAMKKRPMQTYQRATGRYPITGTTAAESVLRTTSWVGRGCNTFSDSPRGKAKSNPLSAWLEQDILHYIKRENIEICSVYGDLVYTDADGNEYEENPFSPDAPLHCTGCERTGCMFCPFGAHLEKGETRFQRLRRTHPRQYEFMMGGGEWAQEDGKRLWMPNKCGLGYAKVFEMVNGIYGNGFYRYE